MIARDNLERISQDISIAENGLRTKENKLRKILMYGGAIFVAAPSLFGILFPDYQSWPLKVVLAIIFIAGMGVASPFISRVIDWFVGRMFSSRRSYLKGLEQARLVAESQVSGSG